MKLSMEIFGIPNDAVTGLRKAVCVACEKFLLKKVGNGARGLIKVQEGTCPYTGRSYMHVVADGIESADQRDVDAFVAYVWSFHPDREQEIVRRNSFCRLEDASGGDRSAEEGRESGIEGEDEEETLTCWLCGRVDGEECYDYERDETYSLDVKFFDFPRVPLCSVCYQLLRGEEGGECGYKDGDEA
ncbi:MAG: hypothetical protein RDV41_06390 [Planctomycetota bacterium]|nr:hypothetical protein [Planctomycetota bacterium]